MLAWPTSQPPTSTCWALRHQSSTSQASSQLSEQWWLAAVLAAEAVAGAVGGFKKQQDVHGHDEGVGCLPAKVTASSPAPLIVQKPLFQLLGW